MCSPLPVSRAGRFFENQAEQTDTTLTTKELCGPLPGTPPLPLAKSPGT